MEQRNKLLYHCIYCRLCALYQAGLITKEHFHQAVRLAKERYPCNSVWEL